MPELPEVETTRRGIDPHVRGRTILQATVREYRMRWPVWRGMAKRLEGRYIHKVSRRAKYLLLHIDKGYLMIHLGMSGSLRMVASEQQPIAHDHFDMCLDNGQTLRFRDPRRFGSLHWFTRPPHTHPLLRHLGPEPLHSEFAGNYLHHRARHRRLAVKSFIMDATVVAGVGNIYANEALFIAGIHPRRKVCQLTHGHCTRLTEAIREVLHQAIQQGGTTLRDFTDEQGRPGYFQTRLQVYGRAGDPCPRPCPGVIRCCRISQRNSFYCPRCQH